MHADDLVRETFDKIVMFFPSYFGYLDSHLLQLLTYLCACSIFFRTLKITPPYLSLLPARYLSPDNKVLYQKLSDCFTEKFEYNRRRLWLLPPQR